MNYASDKQVAFIQKLIGEKQVAAGAEERFAAQVEAGLSKVQASANIELLLSLPSKPLVHADGEALTEGYYSVEGKAFKVVKAKSTANLYAKVLHVEDGRASWDYAPGAIKALVGAARLTLDEAKAFGHLHGICMVCARTLTNPVSVEAGIGPICAGRL